MALDRYEARRPWLDQQSRKGVFEVSAAIYRLGTRAASGYGSEPYRLLAQFAVEELDATSVRARARGLKRKAIAVVAFIREIGDPAVTGDLPRLCHLLIS
jgi:hypothetical protein